MCVYIYIYLHICICVYIYIYIHIILGESSGGAAVCRGVPRRGLASRPPEGEARSPSLARGTDLGRQSKGTSTPVLSPS